MTNLIEQENHAHITIITLNTPENYNVLSQPMMAQLQSALAEIAHDKNCRVVILRARGKAFCAGHDLKEMSKASQQPDGGRAFFQTLFTDCSQLMQSIVNLPQPVIAEVQGVATAAGCQLVASCDLAIAATGARFGVNGVNIGLFCSTPMVALSRNIPRKRAFEVLTTGDFLDSDQATELGLINRSVPADSLTDETYALATKIAAKLSVAVKIGKQAFYRQLEMPLDEAYAYTAEVMTQNMLEKDTAEGVSAFLDKRNPDWT